MNHWAKAEEYLAAADEMLNDLNTRSVTTPGLLDDPHVTAGIALVVSIAQAHATLASKQGSG